MYEACYKQLKSPVHRIGYEAIVNAVKRHYDHGLRLFLENAGRGSKIPVSSQRLVEMAKGAGGAG